MCIRDSFDTLPGDALVSITRSGGAAAASRLDSLRHRACGVPPTSHDARGTSSRICMAIQTSLLACIDLAAAARRSVGGAAVSRHELPVQAFERAVALTDS